MNILHINTHEASGGAEQVCLDLFHRQPQARLMVKNKTSDDPRVIPFPVYAMDKAFFWLDRALLTLSDGPRLKTRLFLSETLNQTVRKLKNSDDFRQADIIHLHNIHGGYFDLSALEWIAREKRIVWTLHDMWAMTGGEGYTFENNNYKNGIGETPYLDTQPLRNPWIDRRQHYLELKKIIYRKTAGRITFVPVSHWLENCLREAYVFHPGLPVLQIDNGYDDEIFYIDRAAADQPRILFFNSDHYYKGSDLFCGIADDFIDKAAITCIGNPLPLPGIRHKPYIRDRSELARTYNEHDILILPSRAESFSLVALEAMACGMYVIASDAGALPERIKPEWGALFRNGDAVDLRHKILEALDDLSGTRRKGQKAAEIARPYTLRVMAQRYEDLYRSLPE